jgi:hypothetical protein
VGGGGSNPLFPESYAELERQVLANDEQLTGATGNPGAAIPGSEYTEGEFKRLSADEQKKQRRLIRNRLSAQLHRQRQRAHIDTLEVQVVELSTALELMRRQMQALGTILQRSAAAPGQTEEGSGGSGGWPSSFLTPGCGSLDLLSRVKPVQSPGTLGFTGPAAEKSDAIRAAVANALGEYWPLPTPDVVAAAAAPDAMHAAAARKQAWLASTPEQRVAQAGHYRIESFALAPPLPRGVPFQPLGNGGGAGSSPVLGGGRSGAAPPVGLGGDASLRRSAASGSAAGRRQSGGAAHGAIAVSSVASPVSHADDAADGGHSSGHGGARRHTSGGGGAVVGSSYGGIPLGLLPISAASSSSLGAEAHYADEEADEYGADEDEDAVAAVAAESHPRAPRHQSSGGSLRLELQPASAVHPGLKRGRDTPTSLVEPLQPNSGADASHPAMTVNVLGGGAVLPLESPSSAIDDDSFSITAGTAPLAADTAAAAAQRLARAPALPRAATAYSDSSTTPSAMADSVTVTPVNELEDGRSSSSGEEGEDMRSLSPYFGSLQIVARDPRTGPGQYQHQVGFYGGSGDGDLNSSLVQLSPTFSVLGGPIGTQRLLTDGGDGGMTPTAIFPGPEMPLPPPAVASSAAGAHRSLGFEPVPPDVARDMAMGRSTGFQTLPGRPSASGQATSAYSATGTGQQTNTANFVMATASATAGGHSVFSVSNATTGATDLYRLGVDKSGRVAILGSGSHGSRLFSTGLDVAHFSSAMDGIRRSSTHAASSTLQPVPAPMQLTTTSGAYSGGFAPAGGAPALGLGLGGLHSQAMTGPGLPYGGGFVPKSMSVSSSTFMDAPQVTPVDDDLGGDDLFSLPRASGSVIGSTSASSSAYGGYSQPAGFDGLPRQNTYLPAGTGPFEPSHRSVSDSFFAGSPFGPTGGMTLPRMSSVTTAGISAVDATGPGAAFTPAAFSNIQRVTSFDPTDSI